MAATRPWGCCGPGPPYPNVLVQVQVQVVCVCVFLCVCGAARQWPSPSYVVCLSGVLLPVVVVVVRAAEVAAADWWLVRTSAPAAPVPAPCRSAWEAADPCVVTVDTGSIREGECNTGWRVGKDVASGADVSRPANVGRRRSERDRPRRASVSCLHWGGCALLVVELRALWLGPVPLSLALLGGYDVCNLLVT